MARREAITEVFPSAPTTACTLHSRKKSSRFFWTVGESCPLSVTRITREPVEGESVARDYEFSRKSIDQHIAEGYALTAKTLKTADQL